MGEIIAAVPGCPGTGLEKSVITNTTAALPGGCRFEVHVNTTGQQAVIAPGAVRPGDTDLVLHCAVCREHAFTVIGSSAAEVFGPVPRDRVLRAMLAEPQWAQDHACRAMRFSEESRLCSKIEGGEWYLTRYQHSPVVETALDFQHSGRQGPSTENAAGLVDAVCDRLRDHLESVEGDITG